MIGLLPIIYLPSSMTCTKGIIGGILINIFAEIVVNPFLNFSMEYIPPFDFNNSLSGANLIGRLSPVTLVFKLLVSACLVCKEQSFSILILYLAAQLKLQKLPNT